jgi:hypothetical protein
VDERAVAEALRKVDHASAEGVGDKIHLLAELTSIYEGAGIVRGDRALALHNACPQRDICWGDLAERARPSTPNVEGNGDAGSISWPWIGQDYRPGGLAILALNLHLRDEWFAAFALEYAVAATQIEQLRLGRRRSHNSLFAYRSLASAHAILQARSGQAPEVSPAPLALAEVLQKIVRLQAVKCSPLDPYTHNGSPGPGMIEQCAPHYLAKELVRLGPQAILVLGADVEPAV